MSDILGNILTVLAVLTFGYLWGSIQNGVIIGKLFFKKDPREYGSHNSGGTNSGRLFGEKVGLLVIFLDMLKGAIAFWSVWAVIRFSGVREVFAMWDDGVFYCWLTFFGVVVGHCYPLYADFKGGKAVSSFMGSLGGTSWVSLIYCFATFFPLYRSKRIVSAASLVSGLAIVIITWTLAIAFRFSGWTEASSILMWNFGNGGGLFFCWEQATVITLEYGLLVFRHRENIKRMKAGSERPVDY
ncbi:MAG: glycerol-3-phosphate 1-O-acyltransferase PlsY [Bacilli bacterium]|jgi:glycerol-3-phosphate acyltransferase PlsY|nr:glycerol-3-phosphate 1-O-acyltransferase PlsY [Bacilli bacterium]